MKLVLSANPKKLKASFENCHQEETLNEKKPNAEMCLGVFGYRATDS